MGMWFVRFLRTWIGFYCTLHLVYPRLDTVPSNVFAVGLGIAVMRLGFMTQLLKLIGRIYWCSFFYTARWIRSELTRVRGVPMLSPSPSSFSFLQSLPPSLQQTPIQKPQPHFSLSIHTFSPLVTNTLAHSIILHLISSSNFQSSLLKQLPVCFSFGARTQNSLLPSCNIHAVLYKQRKVFHCF